MQTSLPRCGAAAALSLSLLLTAGCDRPAVPLSITPPPTHETQPTPLDSRAVVTPTPVAHPNVVRVSAEIEDLPPVGSADQAPTTAGPVFDPPQRRQIDTEEVAAAEAPPLELPSVLHKHDTAQPVVPSHHEPAYASEPTVAPPNQLEETGILAWGASTPTPELFAVARQVDAHVARGIQMAERGASYTARAEFLQALRLSADALDSQRETTAHRRALSAGLAALDEAKSFLGPSGGVSTNLTVAEIVAGHHTPLLKRGDDLTGIAPADAMQRYFTFAQEQLASAGGDLAPAAAALYALGKLEMLSLPARAGAIGSIESARAVVYFQAALVIQPQHALASNELGVLLARHGRLRDARAVLSHSVSIRPEPSAWHNLAVVHAELGEIDLAQRAEQQSKQSAASIPGRTRRRRHCERRAMDRSHDVRSHQSGSPRLGPCRERAASTSTAPASPNTASPRMTASPATWLPWSRSQR